MRLSFEKNLTTALVVIFGIGAVIILNVPVLNAGAKNSLYFLLRPVQQGLWTASGNVGGVFNSVLTMNTAASENVELHQKNNELLAQISKIADLKKENETLRQSLNLELDKDFDLKLANIISKEAGGEILIIDTGANHMIEVGQPVITAQKAIVGRVLKVYNNFSEVAMITEKNFSFDIKIGGDDINGLAKGKGGLEVAADLIPKGKEVKDGDMVVTSILGGIFPPGLLVGQIGDVNKNDVGSFQTAKISLAFDLARDQQVFVASGKYPLGLKSSRELSTTK